jgi:hypothetical protein
MRIYKTIIDNLRPMTRAQFTQHEYRKQAKKYMVGIDQYDLDGNFIQTFDNCRMAKLAIGDAKDDPSLGIHIRDKSGPYKGFVAYATTIRLRCNNSLSNYKPKLQAYMRHVLIDLYSIRKASQSFAVQTESRTTAVVFFFHFEDAQLHLHNCPFCSEAVTWRYRLHLALAHTRLLLTAALSQRRWVFDDRLGRSLHDAQRGQHDVDAWPTQALQKRTNVQVRTSSGCIADPMSSSIMTIDKRCASSSIIHDVCDIVSTV